MFRRRESREMGCVLYVRGPISDFGNDWKMNLPHHVDAIWTQLDHVSLEAHPKKAAGTERLVFELFHSLPRSIKIACGDVPIEFNLHGSVDRRLKPP